MPKRSRAIAGMVSTIAPISSCRSARRAAMPLTKPSAMAMPSVSLPAPPPRPPAPPPPNRPPPPLSPASPLPPGSALGLLYSGVIGVMLRKSAAADFHSFSVATMASILAMNALNLSATQSIAPPTAALKSSPHATHAAVNSPAAIMKSPIGPVAAISAEIAIDVAPTAISSGPPAANSPATTMIAFLTGSGKSLNAVTQVPSSLTTETIAGITVSCKAGIKVSTMIGISTVAMAILTASICFAVASHASLKSSEARTASSDMMMPRPRALSRSASTCPAVPDNMPPIRAPDRPSTSDAIAAAMAGSVVFSSVVTSAASASSPDTAPDAMSAAEMPSFSNDAIALVEPAIASPSRLFSLTVASANSWLDISAASDSA